MQPVEIAQVYLEALRNKYALSELEKVMLEGGQHGVLVADGQILVSDQVPYGSLYIDDLARAARLCSFVRLEARQK